MEHKKFLYTDGRDVAVTESTLLTKKGSYRLKGITDFGLTVLRPKHILGWTLLLIGLTMGVNGLFHFIPATFFQTLSIPMEYATSNILLPIGFGIATLGIALIILIKRKYVLRIETAEGKKNAVISKSREYLTQISNAIRKAKSASIGYH